MSQMTKINYRRLLRKFLSLGSNGGGNNRSKNSKCAKSSQHLIYELILLKHNTDYLNDNHLDFFTPIPCTYSSSPLYSIG